jgi:hypothetical protein
MNWNDLDTGRRGSGLIENERAISCLDDLLVEANGART